MLKFYDCLTAPSPRRVRMLIAEECEHGEDSIRGKEGGHENEGR